MRKGKEENGGRKREGGTWGNASLDNVPITITPKGQLSDKEEIETYLIRI
jgi:hypothetical protein